MRKDDGAGRYIVRQLRSKFDFVSNASFAEAHGEGSSLMEMWQGFDKAVIFDAVRRGSEPGKCYHLQADSDNIPTDFFKYSSHAFSLAEAVELARVLDKLPGSLEIFGVEGEDFSHGEGLSSQVLQACDELINDFTKQAKIQLCRSN